jgi:iron(III) transport system permease protein
MAVLEELSPPVVRGSSSRFSVFLRRGIGIALLAVFAAAVLLPVLAILSTSLTGRRFDLGDLAGPYGLDVWSAVYTDARTYDAWWDTLTVTIATGAFSTVLGVGLAWAVSKSVVHGARFLRIALIVPLFMPTTLTAMGLVVSMSMTQQVTGWLPVNPYSFWGLVIALSVITTPFIYLIMLPVFDGLPGSYEEAGEVFGRSRAYSFRRVTIAITAHASLGAAILAGVRTVEILDIPLMLGTPADINVFSSEIFRRLYASVRPDYGAGTALAMSLTVLALVAVTVYRKYTGSRDFTTVGGKGFRSRSTDIGKWRWPLSVAAWGFLAAALVMPLGATLFGSFQGYFGRATSGMTLRSWGNVLADPDFYSAVGNTFLIASACAALIVAVGTAVAMLIWSRPHSRLSAVVDRVAWLPWMVPGIVLGLGLLWVSAQLFGLGGWKSLAVMVVTFTIVYVPLGARQMSGGMAQIGRELDEASRVAGLGPLGTLRRVTFPLLTPSLLATSLLCFALVARDTSTALFIYGADSETLGIRAINSWREGAPGEAAVYGVVIAMVNGVALIVYGVLRKFTYRG